MLIHAVIELYKQIENEGLGVDRLKVARAAEEAAMSATPVSELRELLV
jgi:NADH-quinone oxidoreductase subunit B